ncbi:MAG: peptide ABC transporter substrate-binding protein, partial [Anaerolineales bacterium]|nr:peptide ABC transporter substrate-binding protein [Anaerolineales bacterium]
PGLAEDTSAITVVNATNIGLTWLDETNATLHPGMAESWDISENGKTYTFHLRQGIPWVKWDGENVVEVTDCQETPGARPVTAYDFEYGIKRALAPETASPYAYVLAFAIQGAAAYNAGEAEAEAVAVKALDNYTLQVTFLEDVAYNTNIIGLWTAHPVPKWLIEGDDCTLARGERWFEPGFFQGFGPFVLKDWFHDSDITMIKNPFWPGTEAIPQSTIDEVQLYFLDDPAGLAEFEAGNLDFATPPSTDLDRIKADPVLSQEYNVVPGLATYYYGFNTKAPFVDDVRVRRALSMAVDRQSLIDNVTKAGQEPAQWFSRPGLAAAPTIAEYPDLGVKYDPVAAKASLDEYLAEKGITAADVDLTLMFNTSAGHQKIAEAIQQMWKDNLGVEVKLTNQEWAVYLETTKDPVNTPQIYRMGWSLDYPDANNFIREVFAYGGSQNPSAGGGINWGPGDANYDEFQTLVMEAAVEKDPAKRMDLYAQAEEILVMTDAAIAPLYWYTNNTMTKPYITRTYPTGGHNEYFLWDTSK